MSDQNATRSARVISSRRADRGLRFTVPGVPMPQGSHKAFAIGKNRACVVEDGGKQHASWRSEVTLAALAAMVDAGLDEPLDGPLRLTVQFRFAMPKSRPKYVKERGVVPKRTSPDLDKLCRAVGDSLTAGAVIVDDRLIVEWSASKVEVHRLWTGADITIEQVAP